MPKKIRLGELMVQQNIVSQNTIDTALRLQVGSNRRLGHILVRMKEITADKLAETLAEQLQIPIITVADKFSPEANKVLPRYLCRQYDVLPLAIKENNILEVAMADPCDEEANNNLEHYTGMAIHPLLARHSDIHREIPRRIPLGLKDFFTPRFNIYLTRIGVTVCLALLLLLAGFTYQYIHRATYGTVTVNKEFTLYKNHDLLVGVDNNGSISLLGRGAYADGYYSVSFKDKDGLQAFLKNRQTDFSEKQKGWLSWLMTKKIPSGSG